MYKLYTSTEGMLKVYTEKKGFYVDVDNQSDKTFSTSKELQSYLKSVKAKFIGNDKD